MDLQLNTLYVFTAGSYLRRDHQTVVVEVEKQARLTLPIHHLDANRLQDLVLQRHRVQRRHAEVAERPAGDGAGVQPGDHAVLSFRPACGVCRLCSMGRSVLCEGRTGDRFKMHDGTARVQLTRR